ncbi:MAG: branched-chain amino acid ABC transporter permease [Lachnospiraceae bacterium]|nr:branched-chain amino acid ABC transporter permease [Lachnospiraceae bacterium]
MTWKIIQAIINGILNGGVYAVVAVGLTIVYGVMKMINFANGEFLMLGMYFTYLLYGLTGWNCYALIPLVVIAMSVFGFVVYKLVIERIIGRDSTTYIMVTVGLSYFLINLSQIIFSATPVSVPSDIKTSSVTFGSYSASLPRLIAFLAACLLIFITWLFMQKTYMGRAMRATSEKPEVAQILGINTKVAFTVAFVLSVILAGVAGLLLTPIYTIYPSVGSVLKTTGLMIVVLGGMGSIPGALLGGVIVGVVEALVGTLISANLGPAGIFAVFLIILYVRPQGIFGKKGRVA